MSPLAVAGLPVALGDEQIRVACFGSRSEPVASRVFGTARVQLRSVCSSGGDLSPVVESMRAGSRVSPSATLCRAGFGRARGVRGGSPESFRADLTRARARIPVCPRPRSGRSRSPRLPVRRCDATR